MTTTEWHANPALATALEKDLQKPHWVMALAVLRKLSPASKLSGLPFNAITGRGDALSGKILGYEQALAELQRLASKPEPEETVMVETYGVETAIDATE